MATSSQIVPACLNHVRGSLVFSVGGAMAVVHEREDAPSRAGSLFGASQARRDLRDETRGTVGNGIPPL
jgi:hypothetical protein